MRVLPLLAAAALAAGAESVPVLAVTDAGRIAVELRGVPVGFELALVELADGAVPELRKVAVGKKVELQFDPGFGSDAGGTGRVLMKAGKDDLSQLLAERGLARHRPANGQLAVDKLVALAQGRAQQAKAGVWAAGKAEAKPADVIAAPAPQGAAAGSGGFVAELNGKFYYPAGHAAAAGIHPQRLIRYATEELARKAGKIADPGAGIALAEGEDETSADRNLATGQQLLGKAVNMSATPERDAVYTASLVPLTRAMQVYQKLVERSPNDAKLQEKLRSARADRYTATKYRRV